MNSFDAPILTFLTHAALRSNLFNNAVRMVADFYLFKGVLPLAILCAIWFKPGVRKQWQREMVVATIFSGLLALIFGRALAHYLPFRSRPVFDPALHLTFPLSGTSEAVLRTWSSFPSDHAMLWASIAMGIFLIWRWAGVIALLHFAIFICLPRVYLGLHYPTDVLAGALIGIVVAYVVTREKIRVRFAPTIVRLFDKFPAASYAFAFVFFLELATQFDEPRQLAQWLLRAL
jgi:undecaprenyl-diphosphatase